MIHAKILPKNSPLTHPNATTTIGTTIGYGDLTPNTDAGRFLLALYAIANCNVMGGFLGLGREFLESYCTVESLDMTTGAPKRGLRSAASSKEIAEFEKEKAS